MRERIRRIEGTILYRCIFVGCVMWIRWRCWLSSQGGRRSVVKNEKRQCVERGTNEGRKAENLRRVMD